MGSVERVSCETLEEEAINLGLLLKNTLQG